MADILPFKKPAKTKADKSAGKANTLCRQGHHKWVIVTEQKFDVKQGRLVTVYKCSRCDKSKVMAL